MFPPEFPRLGRAIRPYRAAYENPVEARRGDALRLGHEDQEYPGWIWCTDLAGRSGWFPKSWVARDDAGRAVAARDYSARELSVAPGEILTALSGESGWLWCERPGAASGWIPAHVWEPVSEGMSEKIEGRRAAYS